jgi:hypothetical protein
LTESIHIGAGLLLFSVMLSLTVYSLKVTATTSPRIWQKRLRRYAFTFETNVVLVEVMETRDRERVLPLYFRSLSSVWYVLPMLPVFSIVSLLGLGWSLVNAIHGDRIARHDFVQLFAYVSVMGTLQLLLLLLIEKTRLNVDEIKTEFDAHVAATQ